MIRKPECAWNLADLENVQQNGIKVMSTFACGGGSSMGYKRAGCTIVAANDIDPEMAWHYQHNLKPPLYYLNPIRDLLTTELPDELFDLDILDGSPPCSTFSMAGRRQKSWGKDKVFREGQTKQVLSDLFFDYLDLVERLKPKVVIAENVKGLIGGNARGYVKLIMTRLKEIGYHPQLFLLNAADCGVPQRRERVFFCAIRNDFYRQPLKVNPKHRWISAGEAVADMTVLTPEEQKSTYLTSNTDLKWWPITKPGDRYWDTIYRIYPNEKEKLWSHRKFSDKYPCHSLTAMDTFKHWSECRSLTFREWKRLGSFPDDYHAKTDKIGKYMVGMSVPPKMTEQVARAVIDQWLQS